jgi:hypothetical protein
MRPKGVEDRSDWFGWNRGRDDGLAREQERRDRSVTHPAKSLTFSAS